MIPYIVTALILIFILSQVVKIMNEYERGVIFRLGRLIASKGPGIIFLIPLIDKLQRMSLRLVTLDVPPQDVITKDNVSLKVNAVVYYRIMDPNKAVVEVADYAYATSQLAQTTLRSVCGQAELDELLAERDKIGIRLQEILDKDTDPWGIKVSKVEIKHIDLPPEMQRAMLPPEMQRAMAKQAEAERERRAKVIHAEGEFQASQKLSEAAVIISKDPAALQLRFLQTLSEIATENNSTILFPIPIDLFKPFMKQIEKG
jgi:regulator of protease activity HflC (stomatin/prohibitin superfamily)